jgi:hypothetical protein
MLADGMTEAEILAAFPDLEREDITEALRYAAEAVRERELPLARRIARFAKRISAVSRSVPTRN